MANIDQLSIEITSDSHKAEAAINDLVKGLTNLENALNKLDVSKITQFTNAVSKLSTIGNTTNVTSKAIKNMANDLAGAFNIRTKKGVEDITKALQELYEAEKMQRRDNTPLTSEMYTASLEGVQKAVEANYRFHKELDDTTDSVYRFIQAEREAGNKVSLLGMKNEVQNYKELKKVLGSSFTDKIEDNAEGLDLFFKRLHEAIPEESAFDIKGVGKSGDVKSYAEALNALKGYLEDASNTELKFNEALAEQDPIALNASTIIDRYAKQIYELQNNIEQFGGTAANGLGGIISFVNAIGNLNVPDISGLVQNTRNIQSQPSKEVAEAISNIGASASASTKEVETLNKVLAESNKTVIEGNEIKNYGFSMKDIPEPKNVEYPPAIIEQAQAYEEKLLPAIAHVGETALVTADHFSVLRQYTANMEDVYRRLFEKDIGMDSQTKMFKQVEQAAASCIPPITNVGEAVLTTANNFSTLSDSAGDCADDLTHAGDTSQNAMDKIQNAADDIAKSTEKAKTASQKTPKVEGHDLLRDLEEISRALKELSEAFEALSEKAEKAFSLMLTPLKHFAGEYVEKFEHMAEGVKNFQKKVQAHMTKLSAFWKRTMKTFTFMLVRKAITAIIKEVGNAIQSLAMYSNAMGTAFNTDISHMVADFQYLGRSIVSVFAPLLNYIVPIIDAIVDRIALLVSYIGMLFAALGGGSSFTKAKKNVDNYADSLDSASKSAKKLTMGIDELNILNDSSGGGGAKPYDGWENAWEEVKIPQWVLDLSDWFKDLWNKFFAPLKEAWNRAKQYLIDGFKTMLDSIKRMFGHIGEDFLEVWNQEKTIRMFEQMIKIVGDLARVVRNLADQFDKAWQRGKVGLKIFENLRDIMAILVDHARNVSYYMIGWAEDINFSPLLIAFEELTRSLKKLADFIGGVFEDVMKYGVLKYIEYMIEDAIPHLMETIAEIVDAFNFATLRERLRPVIIAFEEMFENIHHGATSALGNLGKDLASFVNSDDFAKFLERIAEVTKVLTAERVEKVLTGLGEGIINIGKAVVKFVNSDLFLKFIKAIGEWIDKKSTKDIAKMLQGIAAAIAVFKFGAFTTSKLSGFFKFFSVITTLKKLNEIAKGINGVASATSALGAAAPKVGALYNPLTRVTGAFSNLTSKATTTIGAFKNMFSVMGVGGGLKGIFESATTAVNGFAASLSPLTVLLGSLGTGFLEFKTVSGTVQEIAYGTDNLAGSIGKLVAEVGIASAAFTLLLGFPAGIIAGGCVAAVAAIKGIQDAIDQINMDHISEAVLTEGDMTINQVKEWYQDTTDVITENAQKWTDSSRDIIQAQQDIQSYMSTISGLNSAISGETDVTVLAINVLTGKYESLKGTIDNYVDKSTEALIANLMAQKAYLETQGFDVDQMILDILNTANNTKEAVAKTTEEVIRTAQAYNDAVEKYGYGSEEAKKALEEYKKATNAANGATSQFSHVLDEVKTDEAVKEIQALGNSIDFSEFENPQDAIDSVTTAIDTIKSTYLTKIGDLQTARDDAIDAVNAQFADKLIDKNQRTAAIAEINKEYADMSDALTTATETAFGTIQDDLVNKIVAVGNKAAETWESGAPEIAGKTKAEYINQQIQEFLNMTLGKDGLEGSINELYNALPGNVNNNVVTAMQGIVDNQWNAYFNASQENGAFSDAKAQQFDMMQGILDQTSNLDFDTPASTFANNSWNTIMGYARGLQYDEFGNVVIGGAANSITASKQQFEDANRLVSGTGANAFSQEYKDQLEPLADAMKEQGVEYGKGIDSGFIEGIRSADEQNGIKTELNTLFTNVNQWIHDNPLMPFGSPNKKTKEYGEELVQGFSSGIDTEIKKGSVDRAIIDIFTRISQVMRTQMETLKTNFKTTITELFNLSSADVTAPISKIFTTIKTAINTAINAYGTELLSTILPTFMQTYVFPFFNTEMWQPLFDNLLNMVFIPFFETFRTWFTEEAMTPWWEEDLLFWFADDKWDEDIFDPLMENIQGHWDEFSSWWDTTLTDWWETQVIPWFDREKWKEQFMNVHDTLDEVLKKIHELLKDAMDKAKEVVLEACETMQNAIQEVATAIETVMAKLKDFNGFQGKVTFDFGGVGAFAAGGFPAYGSLFVAGEAGPEFVSNIGGRTGVVSNDEITGIADAVYTTGYNEAELLGQLVTIARAVLDKDPVVIGDREIARMANSGQSKLGMSIIT